MNRALICGITGQTGSYLAELLLEKGYEVHGLVRRSSSFNTGRIDGIFSELHLHFGDMTDASSVRAVVDQAEPDEIYNLAAQSHVRVSFDMPVYTAQVTALGTAHLLDALRPGVRFYQASSSELFGDAPAPQNEDTPLRPQSPYACAKAFAYYLTRHYRDRGYFAVNGILFNHESERRGETFVTRKITRAVSRMKAGLQHTLELGNLEARRDWGYAREYAEAIWLMLQREEPEDFVIGTGETHSVREFLDEAFLAAGLRQEDFNLITSSRKYLRPTEVPCLQADPRRAKERLGFQPKTGFKELVRIMVDHDMELAMREAR